MLRSTPKCDVGDIDPSGINFDEVVGEAPYAYSRSLGNSGYLPARRVGPAIAAPTDRRA
jgi:hypothetical protein